MHPIYAIRFFAARPVHNFLILGAVVLCITGAEALYADMGHFGRAPIRRAWLMVALPALIINYFGQGALAIARPHDPRVLENPFYALAPAWAVYPLVALATAAACIASQALISGMFSVTQQAIQLGFVPRMKITHTAAAVKGQIYVPFVNWMLCAGCIALVLAFREASALAAAYGIAVTGTMATTSMLYAVVLVRRYGWSLPSALLVLVLFLAFDLSFFSANAVKFLHGGWFPITVAIVLVAVMTTWKAGRRALAQFMAANTMDVELFLEDIRQNKVLRVDGTAVFMSSNPKGVPPVLIHHLKHNRVLHKQVVFMSIVGENVPHVPGRERVQVKNLGQGFWQVIAHFGFMQRPDAQEYIERAEQSGLHTDPATTSYYLGRETLLTSGASGLSRWRKALFAFLSRNAPPVTSYFGLPVNRVVEMGTQVEL
jgi:KUP system potassium uptake protein